MSSTEEDAFEEVTVTRKRGRPPKAALKTYGSGDEEELEDQEDVPLDRKTSSINYFIAQSTRTKTSGKTLQDIDLSALRLSADRGPVNYLESTEARKELFTRYEKTLFPEIYFLLLEGANVLTYGFGSKKSLLKIFCDKWLSDEFKLTIYGFFPELTYKYILQQLKTALSADAADEESLLLAAKGLKYDLYLVIHSLDVLLTSCPAKMKQLLVDLVTKGVSRKIHLIASVDHVNSALLWNSKEVLKLNLISVHCPTMDAYSIERGYSSNINAASSSAMGILTLSSVQHVYDSLNPNAQKIFERINNYFIHSVHQQSKGTTNPSSPRKKVDESTGTSGGESSENEEENHRPKKATKKGRDTESEGMAFSDLYKTCREEYLVNSEITLKAQLTEFKDHNLIKFKKRSDGTQAIDLLISLRLAKKFMEKIEENL